MESLDKKYKKELEEIKNSIQTSDALARYLEEEEEDDYKELADAFEPMIQELYFEVADKHPLQLVDIELNLLDPEFEGLYLPKILGFSVLRGYVDAHYKYNRPQNHFKDILSAIIQSSNFDVISKRIGQSIQIGFALSSDIWITNFIESVDNKKIKQFLQAQKLEKYRTAQGRKLGLINYRKQFQSLNYLSAEFPSNTTDLQILAPSIKEFLIFRANSPYENSSLINYLDDFINNESFRTYDEYLEIMMIIGMFFDLPEKISREFNKAFNDLRKVKNDFEETFFNYLSYLQESEFGVKHIQDIRFSKLIDKSIKGEVTNYYQLMDIVHGMGYVSEQSIDAVRIYYDSHEGRSLENQCVRASIFKYFEKYLQNLEIDAYHDYFEVNKVFVQYMGIFANQKFNQDLKELSMVYIRKLLKKFTDKRGKDYQDIKKWVSHVFLELGFLKEKEIVELFKTRRKKKAN
ncbi:MAG TPA: hypothetical protein PKC30_10605 [Saprospiraceae bacterium]|nr:hypothetical protein [Saprospiraceae bacterium]